MARWKRRKPMTPAGALANAKGDKELAAALLRADANRLKGEWVNGGDQREAGVKPPGYLDYHAGRIEMAVR